MWRETLFVVQCSLLLAPSWTREARSSLYVSKHVQDGARARWNFERTLVWISYIHSPSTWIKDQSRQKQFAIEVQEGKLPFILCCEIWDDSLTSTWLCIIVHWTGTSIGIFVCLGFSDAIGSPKLWTPILWLFLANVSSLLAHSKSTPHSNVSKICYILRLLSHLHSSCWLLICINPPEVELAQKFHEDPLQLKKLPIGFKALVDQLIASEVLSCGWQSKRRNRRNLLS